MNKNKNESGKKRFLYLPIKRKWYDMIARGEKKEEFRAFSPHWQSRIDNLTEGERFAVLRNGYDAKSPTMMFTIERIEVRDKQKHIEWGEPEEGIRHFAIRLGECVGLNKGELKNEK